MHQAFLSVNLVLSSDWSRSRPPGKSEMFIAGAV